jgi:glucose/mannose transport system substrate-binding protein
MLTSLVGCSDGNPEPEQVVEVISWWSNSGEREALDALVALHEATHDNVSVVSLVEDNGEAARATIRDRMLGLAPPDVYQANVGRDLLTWAVVNDTDDSDSKLRPLQPSLIVGEESWTDVFPKEVVDHLGVANEVYGVPVNIHRINSLFYNKHVFAALELDPPDSLDRLYEVAAEIEQHNLDSDPDQIIPLVVSGEETWTVSLLFFENLLPAVAGTDFYLRYFQGEYRADHEDMLNVLEETERLWEMVRRNDPRVMSRSWANAVRQVATGRAAMIVMGDWAKGSLQSQGLVAGEDFGQLPFPGTEGTFVYTADTFTAPEGSANPTAALDWLRTVASAEGQRAFNPLKGSIPARRIGVDPEDYDVLSRQTLRDFEEAEVLAPALSALAPPEWSDVVNARLGELLAEDRFETDDLRFVLINYYDLLEPL